MDIKINTFLFTVDSILEFDNTKIDIAGGVGKLKDLRPADSTFYASFTNNINGNWGNGVLTGQEVGGADIVNGKLDLTGQNKYIIYGAAGNANSLQTGCINFKYTPNYSGNPTIKNNMICIGNSTNLKNLIYIYHSTVGYLYLWIVSSTNIDIIPNVILGTWTPNNGKEYEIELNYDITNGATRLFIDRTQFGITQTQIGTRSGTIEKLFIGASNSSEEKTNAYYDDILLFSTVQHVANYAPSTVVISETKYDITNPTIILKTPIRTDALLNFIETSTKTGLDQIKYNLKKRDLWNYDNGAAWVESDGTYIQSNTAAEILINKSTFTKILVYLYVKVFLHSEDGTTTPELSEIKVEYAFAESTINSVSEIKQYLNITDNTFDIQIYKNIISVEDFIFKATRNNFNTTKLFIDGYFIFDVENNKIISTQSFEDKYFLINSFVLISGSINNDGIKKINIVDDKEITLVDFVKSDDPTRLIKISMITFPDALKEVVATLVWFKIQNSKKAGISSESFAGYSISFTNNFNGIPNEISEILKKYTKAKYL